MARFEEILHTSILGIYIILSVSAIMKMNKIENSDNEELRFIHKTSMRFFTNWGFLLQTIYYVAIVLSHYLRGSQGHQKISVKLRIFADYLFTVLVVPLGMVISSTFWVIYSINKDLILPSYMDDIIPFWLNHGFHTFNSILPILDMLLTKHKFPSFSSSVKVIVLYSIAYSACILDTRLRYGRHLYVLLRHFTEPQVVYYLMLNAFLGVMFIILTRHICKWRWGSSVFDTSEKKLT